METEQWADSQSDEDSETDEALFGFHESCADDLHHHPQLDTDIEELRALYSDSAVSTRDFVSIDRVYVDLNISTSLLGTEVAKAWRVDPSEPIVVRLHLSLSQYLDGPVPSVEVFQPSNKKNFGIGKQLENILTVFLSQEWNHLTNEIIVQKKRRQGCFRPRGTMKKRIISPAMRPMNRNHTTSYTIKNPTGELCTYTPNGKRVAVSAIKSPAQLGTNQLIELLFSIQANGHCKATPTLQHGFLVQIVKYAEQRIPTLNEYCVICDERHVFQNGPMMKPAVCTRELCVFSFNTLGVMSGATEDVATGAEVVDLLVAMCRAALQSSRKSIIFDPYPSVVDPCNPQTLAFSPQKKSYDRLQKTLDSISLIRRMPQGPHSEMKKQLDKIDPLAHPLLEWILASNRSYIIKLPLNKQLRFMHTPHQFLLVSSPPLKEALFQSARKLYGSTFAFHGSHIENWHSILRSGLVNASSTKFQLNGAAYGKGIYLSPHSNISFGYSEMGMGLHQIPTKEQLAKNCNQRNKINQEQPGQARFLENSNLSCIALCEVVTSKDLHKHGGIWVCPSPDHVCTRFLFVYENGHVGDVHISTQEIRIQREIQQVIASNPC